MAYITVSHQAALRSEKGRFLSAVDAGAVAAVTQMAKAIVTNAAMWAVQHKESGATLRSLRAHVRGNVAFATASTPQAHYTEKGTRPHVITTKDGDPWGVLANKEKGFFSRHAVMHPGNRAYGWLSDAGRQVAAISGAIVKAHMPG